MNSTTHIISVVRDKANIYNVMILGVAIIIVTVAGFFILPTLFKPGEQRYQEDLAQIDKAVRMHLTGLSPTVIRRVSVMAGQARGAGDVLGRYPSWAMDKWGTDAAVKERDADSKEITTLSQLGTNPVGSKDHSATPLWEDIDGDGKRNADGEKLFYHDASPTPPVDHWNTTTVTHQDVDYVVDSRDWFINFDTMLEKGHLRKMPASASKDNSVNGTGSYSWYVDEDGKLKSMLYRYPIPETDGFQEVYP